MASNRKAGSPAQATETHSAKDAQWADDLNKLAVLWESENKRSLEVRLETGSRLNDHVGTPTKRQPRGKAVLTKASERLGISVPELNRMRWFAHFSKDEKSCWGDTPADKRSWTKFKQFLPGLIAAVKGNEKPSGDSGNRKVIAVVNGVLRSIHSITSQLRTGNFHVDGTKREKLIKELRELGSAVFTSVGVRVQVEAEDEALAVA